MIDPFDTERVTELSPSQFELTVKNILEVSAHGLTDFRTSLREKISGLDGTYEIDITARFRTLGADFLVIAECKHYRRAIEREQVQVLYSRLQAIGAQKGMLFATNGFQKGAIEFATKHRLALVRVADDAVSYETRSLHPTQQPIGKSGRFCGWLIHGNGEAVDVTRLSDHDGRCFDKFLEEKDSGPDG